MLTSLAAPLVAQELNSTNMTRLGPFWRTAESGTRPVCIIAFGDSLQEDYRSLGTYLFPRMQAAWGRAGTSCLDPWGSLVTKSTNVSTIYASTNWWHSHNVLGPGAYLYWHEPYGETASTVADRARLFYLATPDGGSLAVSFSTNGGPWISNLTLNAFSPFAEGRCVNLPLITNNYRIRVDSLSGTNIVLGQQLFLSHSNGIQTVYLQRNGMNLGQFFETPDRILAPIFSNLQPALIIWHMKELGDGGQDLASVSNRLEHLEDLWRTNAPGAGVLYVGTPYAYAEDANSTRTVDQNSLVRAIAVRHGRAYVDGMSGMLSYSYMTNNGYLLDEVHPSHTYYQWLAGVIWDQSLFSLVRKDRTLRADITPEGRILSGSSFTNARQHLLGSSNLIDWIVLATNNPGTQPWRTTNPPANFFRTGYFPAN